MQRIPGLDGLRAIAVLAVLAFHMAPDYVPGGFLGVDLFFVLSGYLITSLLREELHETGHISLRRFYLRRALRILPPLLVTACFAVATDAAPGGAGLAAALFYANAVPRGSLGGLGHTWSLAIEEHFYAAWPLLYLLGARKRMLIAAIVLAIVARLLLAGRVDPEWIYQLTPTRMDALAVGCLLALVRPQWNMAPFAIVAVVGGYFVLPRLSFGMISFGYTAYALACGCLVTTAYQLPILQNRVLEAIGKRSYGLYIYHWPLFVLIDGKWIALAATFAVAEVSYHTVERQAKRLSKDHAESLA